LIDNAIYWTRRTREERGESYTPAIAIRTLIGWAAEGPAIAVLDNGPGFGIEPEMAIRPFVSTRAGGMGLGLYFAKMVMETQGGDLHILQDVEELDIENVLHGAVVAMRFRRGRQ
jgi:nitrogen fixation/metabolism regulation signal transduction histidine kinase